MLLEFKFYHIPLCPELCSKGSLHSQSRPSRGALEDPHYQALSACSCLLAPVAAGHWLLLASSFPSTRWSAVPQITRLLLQVLFKSTSQRPTLNIQLDIPTCLCPVPTTPEPLPLPLSTCHLLMNGFLLCFFVSYLTFCSLI